MKQRLKFPVLLWIMSLATGILLALSSLNKIIAILGIVTLVGLAVLLGKIIFSERKRVTIIIGISVIAGMLLTALAVDVAIEKLWVDIILFILVLIVFIASIVASIKLLKNNNPLN